MLVRYRDRVEAGRLLAGRLARYAGRDDVVVLALPRGGVPVGFEVARSLRAPLDVFLVRKLGAPGREELAMGAIATGGVRLLNRTVVEGLGITPEEIERVAASELDELQRREQEYHGDRDPAAVAGKVAILIDDGLATGSTMRSAIIALRKLGPSAIVVAVPIASAETCSDLSDEVDEIVCAQTPEPFYAVGMWYEDFTQTTDAEVRDLLARARDGAEGTGTDPAGADRETREGRPG